MKRSCSERTAGPFPGFLDPRGRPDAKRLVWGPTLRSLLLAALAGLGACSGAPGDSSQAAARVNKEEITVNQINAALPPQQRESAPEPAAAAARQALERLIDQELAFQRADELKLGRDPRVHQMLKSAQREILARAYAERIGEAAAAPTPEQIQAYFDANPALFAERRLYSIQQFAIETAADQLPALRAKLAELKSVPAFVDYLIANDMRFVANQAVRAAEQLPPDMLKALAAMQDGQALADPVPGGAQVAILIGSRAQPLTLERSRPLIEQILRNVDKQRRIEQDRAALRAAASVQYLGKYAERPLAAASAPAGNVDTRN